jgi:hypothetical protein
MKTIVEYIKTIFQIDNNTAATLVITLSVFILGYIISGLFKSFSSFNKRKNYRKIFKEMITEISNSTKEQSLNYFQFIKQLNPEYEKDFQFKTKNIDFLSNFNKIPFETFYNSYFQGFENICMHRKLKYFNKTFGLIDSLNKQENNSLKLISELLSSYEKNKYKWDIAVEDVRLMFEEMLLSNKGNRYPTFYIEILEEIDTIIYKWQSLENRTHFNIAYIHLIKPLIDCIRKNDEKDITKSYVPFLNKLVEAEYHYLGIKKTIEMYRITFTNIAFHYKLISKLLTKINIVLN